VKKNGEVLFFVCQSQSSDRFRAVLRLIREAIGLDNQRTKPSFQYGQLDARNAICCASFGDICTQLYKLEKTKPHHF